MIHLIKLAVGVRDVAHLAALQEARRQADPPLRHQTRNSPKRAEELCAGGSIYWVIGGVVLVRQRVLDIIEDHWDDGSRCAGLVLDPALVRVQARADEGLSGLALSPAGGRPGGYRRKRRRERRGNTRRDAPGAGRPRLNLATNFDSAPGSC